MLLWKGRFPSTPPPIILEVDGAPNQDGSPGTSVCHQRIFHPKFCCCYSWSCKGRRRERGGKASTAAPFASRTRTAAEEGGAAFPGTRAPESRRAGKASSAPAPKPLPRHGFRASLPSAAEPGQQESLLLVSGNHARLKSHPSDNFCFTLFLPPKIIAH